MTIIQACGVCLCLLIFLLQMGKEKGPSTRSIVFAASILFFSASLQDLKSIFPLFENQAHFNTQNSLTPLLKALGIAVICQFTSELCRDAGETVLACRVEFFAKVEIILLSLPLLQNILLLAGEFAA